MKLIIFGATGSLGRHLVEQALAQGEDVTAFLRDASKLDRDHQNLRLIEGDVLNPAAVDAAVKGHDAVLIALGAGRKGGVRAQGTKHIIEAMERHNVRRLVCQTTLGAGDSHKHLNFFWKHIMFGWLLKQAMADHEEQEAFIRQSKLDWITVRPAAFTDGPVTGDYKLGFPPSESSLALKISRADVASVMLQQMATDTYLHKSPGLSY
ncbi:MAG: SDR family oxidoreductase [Rhodobiaceae bacterium]|nr:SDR family oxidoreductase [Rhodobiaceae bacterium]